MKARLLEFLRAHQVLTLAVSGPYAAAVYYAVDDELNLYFVSEPDTRHASAILTDNRVAGTIHRDRQHWKEIRGVQLTGRCYRLDSAERVTGWALLMKRAEWRNAAQLAPALAKVDLWKVVPDWMRLIDNSQGFGHKDEWCRPTTQLSAPATRPDTR